MEFTLGLLISILWWVILFPVVWLVSLPFVMTIALFSRPPYRRAVTNMLASVSDFWCAWGFLFTS